MPEVNRKVVTPMQRAFAKHMARTGDAVYAATKAGYAHPAVRAGELEKNDAVMTMTREEVRKFLREDAGGIVVQGLVEIGTDPKQPAGARVQALDKLGRFAGLGEDDQVNLKDLGEWSGDELHRALDRLNRQTAAIERTLADAAKPVIEAGPTLFD